MLGPSSQWLPLVERGVVEINRRANRLVWTDNGQFAAALVPTSGLAERLASLPITGSAVQAAGSALTDLTVVAPALEKLQLISTIGAVASVANVGISLVGFAVVLHRLNRIEGKLDQMMTKVDELKHAVEALGIELHALLLARLSSAHANLDRAVVASTERERTELARDARRLFQETRLRYLELWKRADPWNAPDIEIPTALELQGRYAAAAIGELQAEFILGDEGAFVHVSRSAADDVRTVMKLDAVRAFRARTDAACLRVRTEGHGPIDQAHYAHQTIGLVGEQVKLAGAATSETVERLRAFEEDAQLPNQLKLPPHEILLAMKEASGVDVVSLGDLRAA
jgi:hypothetical protein